MGLCLNHAWLSLEFSILLYGVICAGASLPALLASTKGVAASSAHVPGHSHPAGSVSGPDPPMSALHLASGEYLLWRNTLH